ncbi:hypothetical protein A3J90_01415 [candidate division WOR-1 bacterium RIFOXYC2_FULL_37_10]|nr:MAG: hypothetical protein A3J90_01415 [candidate division WOR-1 bacterium RIFOXYC2_FULL_37_10]
MKMARMTEEGEKLTYLDLILQDINENQKTSKGFVPSIIIVSDETKEAIEENIMNFCKKMGLKLFLLNGSAGKRATEKAYEKFKAQKPGTALLLKIVTQPSVPYISKDGKNIGDPYMKGHGDTYEILRIQAKDFIEVTGLKILQIRNIDNIGATFHEAILGFFSNETETNHRQAMVETAPKFMGDKGGTPALKKLSNTNQEVLAIWEQPEVPAAELEKFLSLSPYGDFNTNTLWLLASALMQKTEPMELPLMLSKTVGNYLKLETILGHGLASFNSFALRIDRGLRFIPFKDLFDLYWGRTDAFQLYRGRLMPCQKNGEWIRRPLGAFSKAEFPDVDTLNGSFFNFGAQDRTRGLSSFVIGGAGSGFNSNQNCSFISKCALELNGDVMIISKGEGSKLVIEGTGINDTISVENSVIVLNSGEVHVISSPVIGKVDNRVTYQLLEETLLAAGPRWTPEAIEKIATNLMYRKTHPNSTG